jgi:hypothetical protein
MRFRPTLATALPLVLGACGGGPPSPPALAYGLPATTTVSYVSGDTARMDIDANGQSMQARVSSATTLATTFSRAADGGVQVSMTVADMDARMSNPAGPPASASAKDIDGPLVFTLDRRGAATIVSEPKLNVNAQQFFQPLLVAHTFFPRLPGRGVDAGASWTDTTHVEGPQGEGQVSVTSITTYTVAGDTVVDGHSLVRIDLQGTTEQTASGVIAGMDFSQSGTGSATGWVLWDMARGLMTESYTETDATGTMDVSAAPFPLGIRLRQQSRVKLAEGM